MLIGIQVAFIKAFARPIFSGRVSAVTPTGGDIM